MSKLILIDNLGIANVIWESPVNHDSTPTSQEDTAATETVAPVETETPPQEAAVA